MWKIERTKIVLLPTRPPMGRFSPKARSTPPGLSFALSWFASASPISTDHIGNASAS
jgi:hypothetical protein